MEVEINQETKGALDLGAIKAGVSTDRYTADILTQYIHKEELSTYRTFIEELAGMEFDSDGAEWIEVIEVLQSLIYQAQEIIGFKEEEEEEEKGEIDG